MNSTRRDMVGVILAGGRGTRMAPFTNRYPKPILPICNIPLMEYHLQNMVDAGLNEVFVVVGHLGYEIALAIGRGRRIGIKIHYIEQSETLGIAHALGQLQSYVKSPFVLFLGDIFFKTSGLPELVENFREKEEGSILVVKEDEPKAIQKNFAVILDPETNRVRRVIEKPRYTHNRLKGCGLYLFDLPIFDAIRRTPRTAMRDEYEITDAIQILIDDGEPVEVANVVEEDINLTTPNDLHRCNMAELDKRGGLSLIDETASVHPQAVINHCVIGAGASIGEGVSLENCVVFANSNIVKMDGVIRNYIITPETAVDCSHLLTQ